MKKTHTPGPWKTRKGSLHGTVEVFRPNTAIKKPYYPTELATVEAEDAEGRANARLIAAAPDMLQVLQDLQESAAYWSEYDVPLGIVERIHAAIAKATGPKEPAA